MTSPKRSQRETGSASTDPRRRESARLRPRPEIRAARARPDLARRATQRHRARRVALVELAFLPPSRHEPPRIRAARLESGGVASGGGVARLRNRLDSRSDGATPTRAGSAAHGNERARQSGPRRAPRRPRDRTRLGAYLDGWRLRALPRRSARESTRWTDRFLARPPRARAVRRARRRLCRRGSPPAPRTCPAQLAVSLRVGAVRVVGRTADIRNPREARARQLDRRSASSSEDSWRDTTLEEWRDRFLLSSLDSYSSFRSRVSPPRPVYG